MEAIASILLASWLTWLAYQLGLRLLRRFTPENALTPFEILAFSCMLGFGVLSYLTFALGALALWYRSVFWIVLLLLSGFCLRYRKRKKLALSLEALKSLGPGTLLWTALTAVFLLLYAFGDLAPETFYDALYYHLAVPNLYHISHRLYNLPDYLFSNFVLTLQFLYGLAITLGPPMTAKLLHGVMGGLLGIAFIAFGQRFLAPGAGALSALLFLSMPVVASNVMTSAIDVGWSYFQFMAVYAVILAMTHPAPRLTRLAGWLTGLAASCKYPGFVLVPLAAGVIVWQQRKRPRREMLSELLQFVIPATLVLAPVLIKNWLFHGNPVYPFAGTWWGEPHVDPLHWKLFLLDISPPHLGQVFQNAGTFLNFLVTPWIERMNISPYALKVGITFLVMLPLTFFARMRTPALTVLKHFVIPLWGVWLLTMTSPRFGLPFLAVLTPLIAEAAVRLGRKFEIRGLVWSVMILGSCTNLYFTWLILDLTGGWRVVAGLESSQRYLSEMRPGYRYPPYEAIQWMNTHLPPDSKILFVREARTFYTRLPVVASAFTDPQPLEEAARHSQNAEDMARALAEVGITHLFLNYPEALYMEPYSIPPLDPRSKKVALDFWREHTRLIWKNEAESAQDPKALYVYELEVRSKEF